VPERRPLQRLEERPRGAPTSTTRPWNAIHTENSLPSTTGGAATVRDATRRRLVLASGQSTTAIPSSIGRGPSRVISVTSAAIRPVMSSACGIHSVFGADLSQRARTVSDPSSTKAGCLGFVSRTYNHRHLFHSR